VVVPWGSKTPQPLVPLLVTKSAAVTPSKPESSRRQAPLGGEVVQSGAVAVAETLEAASTPQTATLAPATTKLTPTFRITRHSKAGLKNRLIPSNASPRLRRITDSYTTHARPSDVIRQWLHDAVIAPRVDTCGNGGRAVLVLVSALSLGARVWRISTPGDRNGLIFDEKYYVNAARVLLHLSIPCHGGNCQPYASMTPGIDPNPEHPPLGKLLIAAGMKLYGDNPFGWRFFPIVFGSLAILAIYWLVRSAGGGSWLAAGAASLMAVDNLSLVHGRIATLDVFVVTFMLVGVALYLRGQPVLAGVTLGVGACVKLVAPQALIVLLLLEVGRFALRRSGRWRSSWGALRSRLLPLLVCLGVAVGVYAVSLTALDLAFNPFHDPTDSCPGSGSSFSNFFVHTRFMLCYAAKVTSPGGPGGIASYPWQWLINQVPINYYTTSVTVSSGGKVTATHALVAFVGEMNPAIILLALPALTLAVVKAIRDRDDLSILAVAWFAGTYLPFVEASLVQHRTSYIYYMVVVLPAVYIAVARLMSPRWLPRAALLGYLLVLGYEFFALYPFRTLV